MLRQFLGDEPSENQLAQLELRTAASGLKAAEAVPLIAPLLNLALPAEYPPLITVVDNSAAACSLVEW